MLENQFVGDESNASGASSEKIQEPKRPSSNASNSEHEKFKRDMLRYKDQVAELTDKLKQYEVAEQEAKGNLSKVIEKLKQENKELKSSYTKNQLNYALGKIEDKVKITATKLGCKDPDTFYKLIDQDSIKAVSVDEKFNPSHDEIDALVNDSMKRYEHLGFFDKKVNVIDKAPNSGNNESKAPKKLNEMTKEELIEHGKKLGMKTLR